MATKQFALKLDDASVQNGDITLQALADAGADVVFMLTNVSNGATGELKLITSKNGITKDHVFTVSLNGGNASQTLSPQQVGGLYADAKDGDWDYVEARWTIGQPDTPDPSSMYTVQGGAPYNYSTWPPRPRR